MHLSTLLPLLSFPLLPTAQNTTALPEPPAPPLTFLYTSYVHCRDALYRSPGPLGTRTAIPIIGGNFTGPRLSGTILPLGADWGLTDPRTGVFSADTRYNLRTDDGTDIFVRTSGPAQPGGGLQLRALFEVGVGELYWLNEVVAVGVLSNVDGGEEVEEGTFWLRIDVWHMTTENDHTKYANGSMEIA
ncbi:hypothetical protein WHR41_06781 [Cladosporium halotolerans]|uniref:Uncharacterized protein n=1 Tax=Cladosporium halotolerans TaxID=1052096 RepID=A0AB34KKX7_9PEZI